MGLTHIYTLKTIQSNFFFTHAGGMAVWMAMSAGRFMVPADLPTDFANSATMKWTFVR